jgi:hypothetical protein
MKKALILSILSIGWQFYNQVWQAVYLGFAEVNVVHVCSQMKPANPTINGLTNIL